MKFEISGCKLEQVIFKYLDSQNFTIKETPTNYYFFGEPPHHYAKINVRKSDEKCFIYPNLIEHLSSFFSISDKMSTDIILKYAESKLNNESTSLSLKLYGDN
jgi:hypothetical protein